MLCLLRHGADTSNQYLDGNTPQHEAVCWEAEGVVTVLLDREADVNARNCEDDSSMFLFSCCSDSYSVVEKLVEFGASVEEQNVTGHTLCRQVWLN